MPVILYFFASPFRIQPQANQGIAVARDGGGNFVKEFGKSCSCRATYIVDAGRATHFVWLHFAEAFSVGKHIPAFYYSFLEGFEHARAQTHPQQRRPSDLQHLRCD
jgi:hypothetical protein